MLETFRHRRYRCCYHCRSIVVLVNDTHEPIKKRPCVSVIPGRRDLFIIVSSQRERGGVGERGADPSPSANDSADHETEAESISRLTVSKKGGEHKREGKWLKFLF